MKLHNTLWWALFFCICVSIQNLISGIDVLVIGLLISMQEKNFIQIAWVLPLIILIQEGSGSMLFGASIVWYFCVILIFVIGRFLFEVENTFFMFMVSTCMGVAHVAIIHFFAMLQDAQIDLPRLVDEGILQVIIITLAWSITNFTRNILVTRYEHTA